MRIPRTIPAGVRVVDGFPIPAGGAGEGDGTGDGTTGDGTGDGGEGDGTDDGDGTGDRDGSGSTDGDGTGDDGDDGTKDKGRAGGEEALRADLARERTRRKAAETRARELESTNEDEAQRREREIRETAQAPAIQALRLTAVETAARDAGFTYPEDVYSLLTADERDEIEIDLEAETPTIDRDAAAKIVKSLAKRRPALIETKGDGDDGDGSGGSDHQAGGSRRQSSGSSSDPNATLRGLFRQKLGTPSR